MVAETFLIFLIGPLFISLFVSVYPLPIAPGECNVGATVYAYFQAEKLELVHHLYSIF